jgi:hypothetical protein
MRKLLFLPFLALVFACSDTTLVEPPVEGELDLVVTAEKKAAPEVYVFQGHRDWFCGEDDGCLPGTSHTTPSNVAHGKGIKIRLNLTGELVGELWVTVNYNLNLNTGHGVANGISVLNLTEPGIGSFECKAHADWSAWVEHVKYFGCIGTGDFEGKRMRVWATDELNPMSGEYEGTAEIW